jgi:hypothetical protein
MRWPAKFFGEWYSWFAWHPVRVGRQIVWLEWVERKADCAGGAEQYAWYDYRERQAQMEERR